MEEPSYFFPYALIYPTKAIKEYLGNPYGLLALNINLLIDTNEL